MSRNGKKPIPIPGGVTIQVQGRQVKIEGAKGKLEDAFRPEVHIVQDSAPSQLRVIAPEGEMSRKSQKIFSQYQGLTRSLLFNMVQGVHEGFRKELDIHGTGYTAKLQGREVVLSIGFCHPIILKIPEGIQVEMANPRHILVIGCCKQQVGQFAANIRAIRPPSVYLGKGIRYRGEMVRQKPTKNMLGGD